MIKLVATDLDGTLLTNQKKISEPDWNSLQKLGEMGVVRVAATGRSLFKVKEVLPENSPFDYIVFSSGAGVVDWKNDELLQHEYFSKNTTEELLKHMLTGNFNFFVFKAIPNNNQFYYHRGADVCIEFENYLTRHEGDFEALNGRSKLDDAGQILAIIPNNEKLFESLKAEILQACKNVRVIRATSPVNNAFIWLEVFPDSVSKGHGIKWLCDQLKIEYSATVGVGNDYNDQDMFEFVAHPYVLSNGIDELKKKYSNVAETNENNGFTAVIERLFSSF